MTELSPTRRRLASTHKERDMLRRFSHWSLCSHVVCPLVEIKAGGRTRRGQRAVADADHATKEALLEPDLGTYRHRYSAGTPSPLLSKRRLT